MVVLQSWTSPPVALLVSLSNFVLVTQASSFWVFLHQLLFFPGSTVAKPRRSDSAGAQPSTRLPLLAIQLPVLVLSHHLSPYRNSLHQCKTPLHQCRLSLHQCTVEQYSLIKPKKYLLQKLNLGLKASLRQNGRFWPQSVKLLIQPK